MRARLASLDPTQVAQAPSVAGGEPVAPEAVAECLVPGARTNDDDVRFYFGHGRSFSGTDGNAGQFTVEQFDAATERLKAKWGDFISTESSGLSKNRSVAPMAIRVRRRNPIVTDGN